MQLPSIAFLYEIFKKSSSVQTDTRKLKLGDIYFALKGPNFNGNAFALAALEAGASFAVVDETIPNTKHIDERILQVADVLTTLQDLAKNKVNIAPTLFVEKGDRITLAQLFDKANWKEAVLKPAISGAARQTYRIHPNNCSEFETLFQELIENESMLFQEFLNNIITQGEISLILIGGKYTHAVKKIAKKGDFRVQDTMVEE